MIHSGSSDRSGASQCKQKYQVVRTSCSLTPTSEQDAHTTNLQKRDAPVRSSIRTGAVKSPDATWVSNERWNTLTKEEQQQFSRLSPDFVVELRSKLVI